MANQNYPVQKLMPVDEGTLPAIYGADRYVFPDLPGYYQYRIVAYSTAVKEIISLAVQRGGVWSELQPPFL